MPEKHKIIYTCHYYLDKMKQSIDNWFTKNFKNINFKFTFTAMGTGVASTQSTGSGQVTSGCG
jgi:hypothetical protein